jgi:hypothetical protein
MWRVARPGKEATWCPTARATAIGSVPWRKVFDRVLVEDGGNGDLGSASPA